jgi:ABC-type nitrate/sulfonate/bicarbonate transport system ATPase subunit
MSIAVSALSKRFLGPPAHQALDGLNLDINEGEFLCLVGPSGSGKTTLLRILAGLDSDFSGELRLPPGLRAAIVFQEPRLMPWSTALHNLLLVAPAGDADARRRALELLRELDVATFADAFPGQISGGMQRRVALARALLVSPDLMLMDEPFVSVDKPTAEHLRALVVRLWRDRRITILFVTHDLSEAMALGTRLVFLTKAPGRVLLDWPLDLPPPDLRQPAQIHAALTQLLAEHPRILEGGIKT